MCDACIIASVKDKMLSRRALIGGALAASAPAVMPASAETPRNASRFVDITHNITPDFPLTTAIPVWSLIVSHGTALTATTPTISTSPSISAPTSTRLFISRRMASLSTKLRCGIWFARWW